MDAFQHASIHKALRPRVEQSLRAVSCGSAAENRWKFPSDLWEKQSSETSLRSKKSVFQIPNFRLSKKGKPQASHASWDVDLMNWNSALSMDHLLNLSPKTSPQNVPRIQSPKKPVVFATDRYLEPTWNQYTKLLTKSFPIKRQFHNPLWGITRWSSTMPPQTVAAFGPNPSNNPVQTPCF